MNTQEAISRLDRYIRSRYPVIGIVSHEETRVLASINQIAEDRNRKVAVWSMTQGLTGIDQINPDTTTDPTAALSTALAYIQEQGNPNTLFVMKDMHNALSSAVVVRSLRDCAAACETSKHTIIILAPSIDVPGDLEKTITVLDWPLPDLDELGEIVAKTERNLPSKVPQHLNGNRETVVKALQGLTAIEAENALLSAVVATGALDENVLPYIVKEKAQIVRKSASLEFYEPKVNLSNVGGLKLLKEYVRRKLKTFGAKAKEFGLPTAKGVLLVGVPGTGKSLTAKAIAAAGNMPLLMLNMSAVPSGTVGGGEGNIRQALKIADAIAPCVLFIDEAEKGLADNNGASDGGMMQRIRGTLLTWMQEHETQVYVTATANNIQSLPAEFISRFDDTFFVDLPGAKSRAEILNVQLTKYGRSQIEGQPLEALAAALWGYTGREIERVVKTALEMAFDNDTELTGALLAEAVTQVVPISRTMRQQIDDLRAWAADKKQAEDQPFDTKPVANASNRAEVEI